MSAAAAAAATAVDEDLHSRQLAVYGRQAMGKLSSTNVLISGLNGLGAEIAKNVILAQVGSVTLHDNAVAQPGDLGSHFYLHDNDVGANRAEACLARLQELNPTVKCRAVSASLSEALVHAHDVVVLVGHSRAEASAVSAWARSRSPAPARVCWTSVNGLFGFVCNDFGAQFDVLDTTGENPRTAVIANIVPNGDETLVSCVDDERIDFEEGDIVKLVEIDGMDGIDEVEFTVKDVQKTSFKIGSTTQFSPYKNGGTVVQQKQPKTIEFAPIADAFTAFKGELLETDFSKFGRARLLMLAYEALEALRAENGNMLPALNDADAAAKLVERAAQLNAARAEDARVDGLDDAKPLLHALALTARAVLNPMAAFFGGIVGQEVIKAATGKFHPIHQWLLFDSLESNVAVDDPTQRDAFKQPEPTRYEHQIAVFGKDVQQKLQEARLFMVGAGALGCEFLKNFAMMGVATAGNGSVTLTDDDTIERSNLSRQFLFRNSDVGKSKSDAASAATQAMNKDIKLNPMQDRVSPLTENIFNDKFWNDLTLVVNALDNVKARLYVDRRCVFFNKALLESGTLGTKCNTQVVIPHITENYGASRDPEEKVTPDCTLHNFPSNVQHCLSWARSEFIGQFTDRPRAAHEYQAAASPDAFLQQLRSAGAASGEIAQTVDGLKLCIGDRPKTFADCVAWARMLFEEYFVRKVRQLTHLYPADAQTKSGMPFWSPPKRFPEAESFSPDDALHVQFVQSAAALRATTCGVAVPDSERRSLEHVKKLAAAVAVPEWAPKDNFKIKLDEKNGGEPGQDDAEEETDEQALASAVASLPKPSDLAGVHFAPQEFEKDDASNFHMDFIHSVANLRARNYRIKEVDQLQSKLIAGRIIPAIATTTAAATGLVCLELYKQLQAFKLEAFRNAFVNLALPVFQLIEPMPPAKVKSRSEKRRPDPINHPDYVEEEEIVVVPGEFTVWDHLVVDEGDITMQEFIDYFAKKYDIECQSIAIPVLTEKGETAAMAYNSFSKGTHSRLPEKLSVVFARLKKIELADYKKPYFQPSCLFESKTGESVETPELIFKFRKD